jgi:predicted Zn-dependent protease
MDVYYGKYFATEIIAQTKLYNFGVEVDGTNDYAWAKILLNQPIYDTQSPFNKQGSIAHEMGHAFGLDHMNDETDNLMCQLKYNRSVNKPDTASIAGINFLY